jgi:hypothetical protein
MGLVRTFSSEYECGLVAGNVTAGSKQRGTFLLAEERREVLRRLGGGQSSKATANGDGNYRSRNEILLQMQKQQTVFSSYSPLNGSQGNSRDKMLPVRKHVDHVLIRKFALKVASLASQEVKTREADVDDAFRVIHDSWKFSLNDPFIRSKDYSLSEGIICTLRLREAPIIALRRVLRLFLCASGGPGRMRDATNGWLNIPTKPSSEEDFWHNVTYPGLSSRLGLASFELKHCYAVLSAAPDGNDSILHSSCSLPPLLRVFRHQSDFRLFEIGVDIRSFINIATESYEIERINRRKQLASAEQEAMEAKEKSLSGNPSLNVQAVHDQFEILTVSGRRKFVKCILASCHHHTKKLNFTDVQASRTCELVESDIASLHADEHDGGDGFVSDIERMIVATSVVCHRVLQYRIVNSGEELDLLCRRPWLRHLSFDSILVYVIWDCIPVLERNGRYATAISFLATILFGSTSCDRSHDIYKLLEMARSDVKPYVQFFLPRNL